MGDLHPIALFRLSVIGPLTSRDHLPKGELKRLLHELASKDYDIPDSSRSQISESTIESWYYRWQRGNVEALNPKIRSDRGISKIDINIQEAILTTKQENPRRSIDQIRRLLQERNIASMASLPRSSVHRLLQQNGLSRITGSASEAEEYRTYEAKYAGDIWVGDVMHGPRVPVAGKMQKVYLVSLMDDASRLLTHTAFCTGEKAVDIESVLKQAVLKRGLPKRLVVDNGAAYRSGTLQTICARLGIRLIYCRPYAPEGKGKLERWHRTFRDQFLSELELTRIHDLSDLNSRLWAWVESVYHQTPHSGLDKETPLKRYQKDLARISALGARAMSIDEIFYHRIVRKVRKDGTVSFEGHRFEVDYRFSGKQIQLVIDPHSGVVKNVEDTDGNDIGAATPLDPLANLHRKRRKPHNDLPSSVQSTTKEDGLIELNFQRYYENIPKNK